MIEDEGQFEVADRRFALFTPEEQIMIAKGLVRLGGTYTRERDPVINFLLDNIHWIGWSWKDEDEWEASLLSDEWEAGLLQDDA